MNRVSGNLLKSVRDIICQPSTELINYELERGIFPKSLKIACVRPLFKGGNKLELKNYRPISVTPIVGIKAVKYMFTKISKFSDRHSILSPCQIGFTRGKSCTDTINSLTEYFYETLNNQKFVFTLFVDFRKKNMTQ